MDGETQATNSEPAQQIPAASSNGRTSDFGSDNSGSNPEVASTENVSQETPQNENKPAGFDPVELNKEQQERFNRVYGNMKKYENKFKDQEQANQILIDRLNELQNGQQQIVSHLQVGDFQEAENTLKAQRDVAWREGKVELYNEANDKLAELKAQKIAQKFLSERDQKTQKIQQVVPLPQRQISGDDAINNAVQTGVVTSDEANIYRSWMNQRDPNGNSLRPWVNSGDIRNSKAALIGRAVFEDPDNAGKSFAEKLKEIDKMMGVQPMQTNGQNVLGNGNLTRGKQTNNIKLSPEIERIAIRTKFGGPKAKSDQDHIDAWKRAAQKSQSKGASR